MAHFAELDDNNTVTRVIVVHNAELLDENGQEKEEKGVIFCQDLFGGRWIQTSYNASFRKHYAGIGYTYDPIADVFYSPQPFPSWTLNTTDYVWEPPVIRPEDGKPYIWNETEQKWDEVLVS
jgi:hypothetical protein